MKQGNVKWFNVKKGYGFIEPADGDKDIFVHVTQLQKAGLRRLFEGQQVSYEEYDDNGRKAAGEIVILQ